MKRLFALALLFGLGFWSARFWSTSEDTPTPPTAASSTQAPEESPLLENTTPEPDTRTERKEDAPPLAEEAPRNITANVPAPINPVQALPTDTLPPRNITPHPPTQTVLATTTEAPTETQPTTKEAPITENNTEISATPIYERSFTVRTVVDEWNLSFFPPQGLTPGQYTFTVTNGGRLSHNFVLNTTELGVVPPAQTRTFTVSLPSGTHTFSSNRHGAEKNMRTTLTLP